MAPEVVIVVVSAGVVAGLISGICYVLSQGIQIKRKCSDKPISTPHWNCAVCGSVFRSILSVLDENKVVVCEGCKLRVCKARCALRNEGNDAWTCNICWHKRSCKPFWMLKRAMMDALPDETSDVRRETGQVREFIEKIVASLLGGNVDNVSVLRLYDDQFYDDIVKKYHRKLSDAAGNLGTALFTLMANLPATGQSPCTAHSALKKTIQDLLREATGLPILKQSQERKILTDGENPDTEQTYEDLLATAVINKVITHYQNNNNNSLPPKEQPPPPKTDQSEKEYFFGATTLEEKYAPSNADLEQLSSIEEWLQNGTIKYVNKQTLKIENYASEEEIYPRSSSSSTSQESDQEDESSLVTDKNWLLQKPTGGKNRFSPVPVAMLVPSPDVEAKVLIGDEEATEMSDLSDAESDDSEPPPLPPLASLEKALLQNKAVIGGGGKLNDDLVVKATPCFVGFDDEEDDGNRTEESADSGVKFVQQFENFSSKLAPEKEDDEVSSSLVSTYSNPDEKNAEYSEKFGTVPRLYKKQETQQEERFGRDYYARQASVPSGSRNQSNRLNIVEQFQQSVLSRNDETQDPIPENGAGAGTETQSIQIEITQTYTDQTSDSDVSSLNYYDVEHSKIYKISQRENSTTQIRSVAEQPPDAPDAVNPTIIKIEAQQREAPLPKVTTSVSRPLAAQPNNAEMHVTIPMVVTRRPPQNGAPKTPKSDSTLIRKIYQDLRARRAFAPRPETVEEPQILKIVPLVRSAPASQRTEVTVCAGKRADAAVKTETQELDELQKQKIVEYALEKFSRLHPKQATHQVVLERSDPGNPEDENDKQLPVKDLRKKFENKDAVAKLASHSLTARSFAKKIGKGQVFLNELKIAAPIRYSNELNQS